ncbi:DUF2750 domain-containing protein [Capnocytophaga felis]|uniref:DUF2750 domain-containing protein n=1 Tax=Capnocytophaga felis TaxID=2267611 RepID=A0A5M4BCK8_9FLAO|nr:DUF2750 domain-containing protein [Capnocytophaga felis]GET46806.1 hypothetical protein RCZ01_21080 [Capnocytophaga felis]GET48508.1 hypothetical protein RCZ02_13390 [Capnocytophaga felis]
MHDFIHKILENGLVFYLKNKKEVAVCSSNVFFIEENNQPISVFPFWSSKLKAESCQKEEWKNYEVVEISLADFMEFWCLGMYEDGVAVGIDFDENLCGEEEIPIDLLKEIINEVEKTNVKITFKNFKSIKHLKNYLETEN